jgi:hypothetical protein
MDSHRQQHPTKRSRSLTTCAALASLLVAPVQSQTVTGDVRIHGYVEARCSSDYIGETAFSGTIDFAAPMRANVPAPALSPLARGRSGDAETFLVACSVGAIDITISATRRGNPPATDDGRAVRFQINLNAFDNAKVTSVSAVCSGPAPGAEDDLPCAFQGALAPARQSESRNVTNIDAGAHWQVSAPVRAGINTLIPSLSTIDTLTLTLSAAH